MVEAYQLSVERPHILALDDEFAEFNCLQAPVASFSALLHAAQSTETGAGVAESKRDASSKLLMQRRLQNRVSCRKTRLKRKLNQHALEVLARDRQERHEYLTQLFHDIGVDGSDGTHQDELYRQLSAKSLLYALVDQAYRGWKDGGSHQESAANGEAVGLPTRRSKRLRRACDQDVSTAVRVNPATPQTSLRHQWRSIVDGLQNMDLKLHRMEERELGAGVFDCQCHWKFVAVKSAKVQCDGDIAAVAVSGITRLTFHGRHVQVVNISAVRRQDNVPFDFHANHED
ncbi:hypothetical protein V7S43_010170 [Phytophthora oleae]|uniref:BZIP domain-containing protein n=1 Tax=Phytophthora oleae TaxID=2107226 RepID=A0ABD3FDH6_9STRA